MIPRLISGSTAVVVNDAYELGMAVHGVKYNWSDPDHHRNFAFSVQRSVELLLAHYAGMYLSVLPWVEGVVLVGGCALNVKANTVILRNFQKPVYIPPAPNDAGLTVGVRFFFSISFLPVASYSMRRQTVG